jgi:hypothetical protein
MPSCCNLSLFFACSRIAQPRRAPLLQSGGPWFDSKCVYHSGDVSSVGTERRFAMPEVEGSTPSRRATHARARPCGVSSADQSSWFRPRRSRVQILHAAPIHATAHRDRHSLLAGSHRGLVALPRKQRVGHRHEGSNPSPAAKPIPGSHRLGGQDISLSRRKLGFDSP